MATKTQRRGQVAVKQMARRVKKTAGQVKKTARNAVAKASAPVRNAHRKVQVTLGDLIAAAFDVAGETKAAAQLVTSRAMSQAMDKHIVFVR